MADFPVGNAGTLRITDDGSTVRFYVICSDPQTYDYDYTWFGIVNGVNVGGTVSLGKGFGTKLLGSWYVGYSQNVSIGQQATNTSGLGGYYPLRQTTIYRATVPPAPTTPDIDQITGESFRVRFSSTGTGGSAITQWQIQLATNSAFTTGVQNISSSGTSTITGLANHTQYWVRARGANSLGWGAYSGVRTASTLGHPTAPQSLAATPSTSVTGRVALTWAAPATTGAGGITGYNIFRDGVQIATTTGTGTGYTDSGLTPYTTYAYTVAARNAYSNSISGVGPQTAPVNAVAPGPPSAPRNLVATADGAVPGKVDLSWTAPLNTGAGGITGYRIYFSGGSMITQTSGTGTTYSVTGLTPGTTYSFQVFALNALAVAEGSVSEGSNTSSVTPIGEPGAPTNVTLTQSVTTGNRLVLSWTPPPGTLSGFSIFRRVGGVDTLLHKINASHTSYTIDGLSNTASASFFVRARTAYTDTLGNGYPGNWGGPASAVVTATASNNSSQTTPNLSAATSSTNAVFNGTYEITGVTSNTISYSRLAANINPVSSGGTVVNNTNAVFNGTYNITASPDPNRFSYAKTNANIAPLGVFGGTVTNSTNSSLNATSIQVTAVNSGARTLAYTKSGSNVSTVAVPTNTPPGGRGTVTNLTNASFNVTGKVLTAVTKYTMQYSQTGSNVAENNAAGVVTNVTNKNVFNGTYSVVSTPDFRTLTYVTKANTEASGVRTWDDPRGTVERATSTAQLDVRYRSGWIG